MNIIKRIQHFIATSILKQELQANQREQKPNKFNFTEIKTVGILMDVTNVDDYEIVKRYVLYLREFKKKVKVLGYFSTKKIPPMTFSKLEYDYFSTKEVNWLGKPSSAIIKNFINEPYDLLIDLNIHDHFPLKYISTLSKANFKVGKYDKHDTKTYDMMIDSDNTKTLKYFLRQIDTYVTMLNKVEPSLN